MRSRQFSSIAGSNGWQKTGPEVEITAVNLQTRKATIRVREKDNEDRPNLYYNFIYGGESGATPFVMGLDEDELFCPGCMWEDGQDSWMYATIDLPTGNFKVLAVQVHDNMRSAFARYEVPVDQQQNNNSGSQGSQGTQGGTGITVSLEKVNQIMSYTQDFVVRGRQFIQKQRGTACYL